MKTELYQYEYIEVPATEDKELRAQTIEKSIESFIEACGFDIGVGKPQVTQTKEPIGLVTRYHFWMVEVERIDEH